MIVYHSNKWSFHPAKAAHKYPQRVEACKTLISIRQFSTKEIINFDSGIFLTILE